MTNYGINRKECLRKERRLRVFENRIPRRLIGPKRDENEEYRRLDNEECPKYNIIKATKCKRLRRAGHLARMEEGGSAFNILTDKPTGKDL